MKKLPTTIIALTAIAVAIRAIKDVKMISSKTKLIIDPKRFTEVIHGAIHDSV